MKLQIAFDVLDLEKCLDIARSVEIYAHSFQIRSSLIFKHGVRAIEQFRAAFPNKELHIETHIINHGQDIVQMCIKSGADWISVMAGISKPVIHGVSTLANQKSKRVMLDLLDTKLIGQSAMDAKKLGIDAIMYHAVFNESGIVHPEEWEDLRGNTNLPLYVDAQTNRQNIEFIIALQPHVIVVDHAITQAKNPAQEAEFYLNAMHNAQL